MLTEKRIEVICGGCPSQIPHINILSHRSSFPCQIFLITVQDLKTTEVVKVETQEVAWHPIPKKPKSGAPEIEQYQS